jgi:hypothetical protein
MSSKTVARVSVSKNGPNGRPVAQVVVENTISAPQLGAMIQKVTTDEAILRLAGLKACLGCKSGLDINILDLEQEVIQVEV